MVGGRHHTTYGRRAKIGLIVPFTNTVNEAEWGQMMPADVTFHTCRMPLHPPGRGEPIDELARAIAAKAAELTPAGVDVVAYACTAGSMVTPARSLPDRVATLLGMPVVTTAAAIIEALRSLGATRVSVATPYHDALNAHEAAFLVAAGIEVLAIKGLGIGAAGPAEYFGIARTPTDKVVTHALSVFAPGSDALLISCTDFPTLTVIDRLEAELAVPVVTSNQATLWEALRAAGVRDTVPRGGGLLFANRMS